MITLSEFLNELEFGYYIRNNYLYLVDLCGANLGNIESERFKINDSLPEALVERLDTYIYDYHISGIENTLREELNYQDDIYPYDEKLIPTMKLYPEAFNSELVKFVEDIVKANIDISELKE